MAMEQTMTATLSPREIQVLQLIAVGKTTARIAEQLGISINTVESHRKNSYRKMGVSRLAEAIQSARSLGILTNPE